MRLLALLLLAACADRTDPADAASSAQVSPPEPGNHALLVGASAVTAPLRQMLADTYSTPHITELEPSSGGAVTGALDSLARAVAPGSSVVVYLSAPGARVRDVNLDEPDSWDEALALPDGPLLDDALAPRLEGLGQVAGSLAVIFDVVLPAEGLPAAAAAEPDGVGDGLADWPRPPSAVQFGLSNGGHVSDVSGHLARALASHAPASATYRDLEQRLLSDASLVERTLTAHVRGVLDAPVFGVPRDIPPAPEVSTFALDPVPIEVHVDLPTLRADVLKSLVADDARFNGWLTFTNRAAPGQFSVQPDPVSGGNAVIVVGPEGAMRNRYDDTGDALVQQLWRHARQHAFRSLGLAPDPDLSIRLVEAPEQPECSRGRWKDAAAGEVQIVPVCHRWQIEVTLAASASGPREVGGVILGNDGTSVGFPVRGEPVVVAAGKTHRFTLPVSGQLAPAGVKSIPPLGIPEHVMVFSGPPDSRVPFHNVDSVGSAFRSMNTGASGAWRQASLVYRIEANPGDDPLQPLPTRELTLDGYDVRPLLPANTNSYLYKLLHNAERLAHVKSGDGLDYAQCLPRGSSSINGTTRYSEERWPGGSCWSQPWEFSRDDSEFLDSPGIDCSTTVWWMFTRACLGDTRVPAPERRPGESAGAYHQRILAFHTQERKCLLFTEEAYRGGYLNTAFMLREDLMSKQWARCDQDALRTGDVLVTKTERGGGGHTYVVIDPDNFVVFGSHVADLDFDRLDDEFKELWAEYERDHGDRDTGVEYQFLTWRKDKEGGRFGGFNSEVVQACWRHKVLAAEWEREPTSRPRTAAMEGACRDGICLTTTQ